MMPNMPGAHGSHHGVPIPHHSCPWAFRPCCVGFLVSTFLIQWVNRLNSILSSSLILPGLLALFSSQFEILQRLGTTL